MTREDKRDKGEDDNNNKYRESLESMVIDTVQSGCDYTETQGRYRVEKGELLVSFVIVSAWEGVGVADEPNVTTTTTFWKSLTEARTMRGKKE